MNGSNGKGRLSMSKRKQKHKGKNDVLVREIKRTFIITLILVIVPKGGGQFGGTGKITISDAPSLRRWREMESEQSKVIWRPLTSSR